MAVQAEVPVVGYQKVVVVARVRFVAAGALAVLHQRVLIPEPEIFLKRVVTLQAQLLLRPAPEPVGVLRGRRRGRLENQCRAREEEQGTNVSKHVVVRFHGVTGRWQSSQERLEKGV